jgi:hypothetical protein
MTPHQNPFLQHDDVVATYQALLMDQRRDARNFKWAMGIGWVPLGSAAGWRQTDYVWLLAFLGVGALIQSLIFFIDKSNRNFLLHLIDFITWRDPRRARSDRIDQVY